MTRRELSDLEHAFAESQPSPAPPLAANFRFPDGFLWGAATSAHQVEGHNVHNDWWAWEQAGRVATPSGAACDHWNRYRSDFDLAQSLGHNAHRFSIEWSRIEPEEGIWDETAIEHYREVLLALRERGIEPVVTLFHYTMPQWMARGRLGEPEDRALFLARTPSTCSGLARAARALVDHAQRAGGAGVSRAGCWASGRPAVRARGPRRSRCCGSCMRAHVRLYHVIHAFRPDARVGIAQHALALSPDDPRRWSDRWSVNGARPPVQPPVHRGAAHRRAARAGAVLGSACRSARTLDFIGVNYYTRDFVRNSG